mmetsp:Transcript_20779/g.35681  ORF Transcript_20779/g.35681 Transcript_20779/m.35681 type:complete len:295 (-) Transcript_20779:12466-13350(-)
MYTPSEAPRSISCFSCFSTSDFVSIPSRDQPSRAWARHTSCRTEVKKPWGLKKPVSQYLAGRSWSTQSLSCSCRLTSSANHSPMLGAGHETLTHRGGTRASTRLSRASCSSADMTMVPAMASLRSCSVRLTRTMTTCSRSTSCEAKILRGWRWPIFCMHSLTWSLFQGWGIFLSRSSARITTCSSRDSPPPPPDWRGWMSRMVPSTVAAFRRRYVMSALACSPKTSGVSTSGTFSAMNSRCFKISSKRGIWYLGQNSKSGVKMRGAMKTSVRVASRTRSLLSVTRPPYWISETM